MIASAHVCANSDERARLVRARACRRDDCLVVERMEGAVGNKKSPPREWEGMRERAMPHTPRLAKESS